MKDFPIIPASKRSLSLRKKVFGVGTNDADYILTAKVDGVWLRCPYYRVWVNMLQRCYSKREQERYPNYIGCTVCDDWLTFSAFKSWMDQQDWIGKHLDKDISVSRNKVYSPSTCMFVDGEINMLLTDHALARGELMIGVNRYNGGSKFQSKCRIGGRQVVLGVFDSELEAHKEYLSAKSNYVTLVANKQDGKLKDFLTRIAGEIAAGSYYA